jgi:inorganic pyrophosphatase
MKHFEIFPSETVHFFCSPQLETQAGASDHAKALGPKGSDAHKAAVIGDTIGDPLKDTSGPSLNILIKLMAVESLVFAPFFAAHGGLIFK